jgi:hypothetical protein
MELNNKIYKKLALMLHIISHVVRKKPLSIIFELLISKYFIVLTKIPDNAEVMLPNNESAIVNIKTPP